MKRELYPDDWDDIARRVKERANWCCEQCGRQCRRPGEAPGTQRHTLTVAHLDHNPANCAAENLRALCAPCHLRYDTPMHARHARATRARRQEAAGQRVLWPVEQEAPER